MKEAVIVSYLRTPISRARPTEPERDLFNWIRSDELIVTVIKELVKKVDIKLEDVDECILGCSNQTAEQWSYGGRLISLAAGLPLKTSAMAIDRQCGSSMSAIHVGAMEIMCGYSDVVIAGGYEHMTHIPMGYNVNINQKFVNEEKRFDWSIGISMGLTAEKLAEESHISKEEMDRWSLRSHQLAAKAYEEGYFKEEIIPIEVSLPDGRKIVVDKDLSVRPDTTLEKISSLPPAFKPRGVITAGNSSPLNDGAAAILLMSKEKAKEYGVKPLAKIKGMSWVGVDPTLMGKGSAEAVKKLLSKTGLSVSDIDFWEVNEAFAVVTLHVIKELGIPYEKVNIKGGAIALGHPLGMTGVRIVGTLARILNLKGARYGVAAACVGGGQGVATLLEREG
ncbi:MAG: acetyl-CoA C-acetyltransferase [Candidatus Bathyarchaeota archaeon]